MTYADYVTWLNNPTAIRNVLVEVVANVAGVDTTFYLSVLPYTSQATDTPAAQPYRAVLLKDDLQTTESISLSGQATMTVGEVGISNDDGLYDPWLTYVVANRPIRMLFGDVRWARADYQTIFNGVSADIGCKSRTSVNLKIRDKMERLNAAITDHLLGGTTANQGSVVPNGFGEIVNMTPLLIDTSSQPQYQVHDGAWTGPIEIRDNGVPIANDAIGWAALASTDLTHGTFKLAVAPAGTVTISFRGDSSAGVTVASIVKRIVTGYGYAANRFISSEIDQTNFANFDAAHPQPISLPVTSAAGTLSVIQQATGSLLAQLTTSREGLLQLQQIDFSNLAPVMTITSQHMEPQSLYEYGRSEVTGSALLTYCPNETPQSNLATSLPAEALSLMALPYLPARYDDAVTNTLYQRTSDPDQEDTRLLVLADANAEAKRRVQIRKVPRITYQFEGLAPLFQLRLNQAVTLTYPRFNLNNGQNGLVVSMTSKWALGRVTMGVMI